ncbi:MAG: hypothetical protein GWN79_16400, partial [Actinobacteria bacterium]|nr:hypothetical protein [Actinomycetota bacterium]NIS33423.1 hypothetical protein [Actinomycetota bacterium]NIT96883.1 hypothetical protein [Actinomycetota bacterium]NIU20557.1 hypothetical protein [Actinomycetota bacterium]NIV88563.1 hypothetical protein [Actinomycetota bacterium]
MVIVGRNAEGRLVRDMLQTDPSLGYHFEGFLENLVERAPGESPLTLMGNPAKVIGKLDEMGVSSVI